MNKILKNKGLKNVFWHRFKNVFWKLCKKFNIKKKKNEYKNKSK